MRIKHIVDLFKADWHLISDEYDVGLSEVASVTLFLAVFTQHPWKLSGYPSPARCPVLAAAVPGCGGRPHRARDQRSSGQSRPGVTRETRLCCYTRNSCVSDPQKPKK